MRLTDWLNGLRDLRPATAQRKRTAKRLEFAEISAECLESRVLLTNFTLELLHLADQEAGAAAVQDVPRASAVLNALRNQDLGNDGLVDNTLTLSSGDAFIPGLFFDASAAAFGSGGIADIQIQNELGIQAIALGNHEFDFGTGVLAGLISGDAPGSILGTDFGGAAFPYLSTNLDFSTDANLAPLATAGGQAPTSNSVTSSVVIDVNGESIGVVGATTPTLGIISSPDGVGIAPGVFDANPTSAQLDALAAIIQTEVDTLLADNAGLDKVILLAHMQQIDIEFALADRLSDVDIIVAGGSNTRLFDSNDRPRAGDSDQGDYPTFRTDADGNPIAVVNTDGSYKYIGRLVIDFDANGVIVPGSYDVTVSGAYATDAQGVTDLNAAGLVDPEIQQIVDAIEAQIIATESNVFGISDVFLNGNRSGIDTPFDPDGVRTQETNLGNLTADANLAAAQAADPSVVVSIKNGGGIRASIGRTVVPPGGTEAVRLPNEAVVDSDGNVIKPEGGISQNDIATTLAFNNGLSLLTLTRTELVDVLEHGVGAIPGVSGRFPQVSGVRFSYDPSLPAGDRIQNAGIFAEDGTLIAELVRDGLLVGDPGETFRIVTLSFLAGGGDGYPFPMDPSANRVDLQQPGVMTGDATFADDGSEQDALAEYLQDNFLVTPYSEADAGRLSDVRIQNLAFRGDTVFPVVGTVEVTNDADFGAGSFRAAVQLASDNPGVDQIVFAEDVDLVVLSTAVEFTGSQDLSIEGNGVTLQAASGFTGQGVFISSDAADLAFADLTIDGAFEVGQTPANGIFVPVPADAEGVLTVTLDTVTLQNSGLFGLHIADQINDSDASISLVITDSLVINNGIGALDFDGVRVDEGGEGDIFTYIEKTQINANGGDGLELDERGDGSVFLFVEESTFNANGFFNEEDLDDGLDVDEAGAGSVFVTLEDVELSDNLDEGLDLDEEDAGSIFINLEDVLANNNFDEGIKASEEGSGGIFAKFEDVLAIGNGDDGIELEEEGNGSLVAVFEDVLTLLNGDEGIQLSEADNGSLFAKLEDVVSRNNAGSGAQFEESGRGSLKVKIEDSDFEDNEGVGIEAVEEDQGRGFLFFDDVSLDDNLDGELELDGVIVKKRGRKR